MLTNLIGAMTSMLCCHEWTRRRDNRRVYLECVHCLATTPGIEIGPQPGPTEAAAPQRPLEVAEAA
jgi:hypothetical protein